MFHIILRFIGVFCLFHFASLWSGHFVYLSHQLRLSRNFWNNIYSKLVTANDFALYLYFCVCILPCLCFSALVQFLLNLALYKCQFDWLIDRFLPVPFCLPLTKVDACHWKWTCKILGFINITQSRAVACSVGIGELSLLHNISAALCWMK